MDELHELRKKLEVEAALDKVRSMALAMQATTDLIDIANELREQMGKLGQPELESFIVQTYHDDADTFDAYWAFRHPDDPHGTTLTGKAVVPSDSSEWARLLLEKYYSDETSYLIESRGSMLHGWYRVLEEIAPATLDYDERGEIIVPEVLFYHFCKFAGGALVLITSDTPSPEARELQRRAAGVFELAYRRFQDLQRVEEQGREALRQASLDRVRGEIASMRKREDLQRITPLIWRELTSLEVPFFRCGIFIMDDQEAIIHAYLSTPAGESLAALHLPYDHSDHVRKSLDDWRAGRIFREIWDRNQFESWTRTIYQGGFIENADDYQDGEEPPDQLALQYVPFKQGMLYVGSRDPLDDDQIQLVESLAGVFSVAYSRYEDFVELEQAKNNVEQTLEELRSTQNQLIHSEKMASLGELTAGIAHEIQNPLNFVNNFSELNEELISELIQELDLGNTVEAKEILNNLISNEKKIKEHGKRAEGIVRSMLQHSRASTDEKVSTDLNILCDEYLRLAYHGMRAKDPSFSARMETKFEDDLPFVKIAPQEIGRVILNLVNNGFYAVGEKARSVDSTNYKPTVKVNTSSMSDKSDRAGDARVIIRIEDNGSGIPEKIRNKVFQPFFSTKPTGLGTGLGLSLSYDIIKAHSGSFDLQSVEGEGTTFTITLPALQE